MPKEKISVMLNNCVAWSAEEFAARFAEICVEFLGTKRCRFTTMLNAYQLVSAFCCLVVKLLGPEPDA